MHGEKPMLEYNSNGTIAARGGQPFYLLLSARPRRQRDASDRRQRPLTAKYKYDVFGAPTIYAPGGGERRGIGFSPRTM